MKYLCRVLGVLIVWPTIVLMMWIGCLIGTVFTSLWHFRFVKVWIKPDDYYFEMSNDFEVELIKDVKGDLDSNWYKIKKYYKTPKDMLLGKLTVMRDGKVVNDYFQYR